MNRLQKLSKSVGEVRKDWDQIFLKSLEFSATDKITREPYKNSALVYTCIHTTAKAISQIPLKVFEKGGKGVWKPVDDQHNWQRLFDRPNYLMDRYSYIETLVSYLLLDGNVFSIPFPSGLPDALYVVPLSTMEKIVDKNGHLEGWKYKPTDEGRTFRMKAEEVAHVKFFNPGDPIMGMKPLEAGRLPLLSDHKAAKYNDVFFDSGAQPGGVLYTDKNLGETQHTRLASRLRDTHRGYRKAHRLMILEGGLKYEQMGLSQRDMDFVDLRRYSRDEILQIFGMKKSIISITDDLNYSTAREQKREWWQDVNLPIMRLITSSLNFIFFQNNSKMRVAFDISNIEALQEEFTTKVETAYKLWQMGYTAEEVNQRLELGFESAPWREMAWMPMNLLPVSGKPAPPKEESHLLPATTTKEVEIEKKEPPKEIPSEVVETLTKEVKDLAQEFEDKRKERIWRNLIVRTDPLEEMFEKKVKRVFWVMRGKILRKLKEETEKGQKDLVHFYDWARLEEFAEEKELIKRLTAPIFEESVLQGGTSFIEEMGLGINFDLLDPAVLEYLDLKPNKVRNVVGTVQEKIRGICQTGAEEGLSVDQIAEKLKMTLNMAGNRAEMIARTEVVGASNFGRHVALGNSGFREKEWFTALDEKVRDDHVKMQGKRIRVGETWILPDGTELEYPGDWNGLAHQVINCRCVEIAAIDEGKEEEMDIEENRPTTFQSDSNAATWGTDEYEEWREGLNSAQSNAIKGYTDSDYIAISDHLRLGESAGSDAVKKIKHIEKALDVAELKSELNVFRMVSPSPTQIDVLQNYFDKLLPGVVFQDSSFVSTSLVRKTAMEFAGPHNKFLLNIKLPAKVKGAYLDGLSAFGDKELEFLIQKGTKFKVLKRMDLADDLIEIFLEAIV